MGRYCKDCRYFRQRYLGVGGNGCASLDVMSEDVVFGPAEVDVRNARAVSGACGPKAQYFESKLTFWQRITGKGAG